MDTTDMYDVICLGQFTADVVVTPVSALPEKGKATLVSSISLHNGGCACNTAVALGKLGVRTGVIGKVGCDALGDFLLKVMSDAGLDTRGMLRDPDVATSSTAVMVSPDGERSFLHFPGTNARMTEADVDYDLVRQAGILHVAAAFLVPGMDGEPMAEALEKSRALGVTTCLDTAWDAEGRWMSVLEPCLAHLDLFVPSLEEAEMLSGRRGAADNARFFMDRGIKTVVLKTGADGCYVRSAHVEATVGAFPVERVVDTLGAGDAFVAGFLAGVSRGWDLQTACRLGNAVGACCVGAEGASGVRPLEETIELYPVRQ